MQIQGPRPSLPEAKYDVLIEETEAEFVLNLPRLPPNFHPPQYSSWVIDYQTVFFATVTLPVPEGHISKLWRRLDTGFICLSNMFLVCYPGAQAEVIAEEEWIKARYPGEIDNREPQCAGLWVSPTLALRMADEYNIPNILLSLLHVQPVIETSRSSPRPPLPTPQRFIETMQVTDPRDITFGFIRHKNRSLAAGVYSVLIGTLRVPSPWGDVLIVRRMDTGVISLLTMLDAVYPHAADDVKIRERMWVRNHFELTAYGSRSLPRFRGSWVPPALALRLAEDYKIVDAVFSLLNATPNLSNLNPPPPSPTASTMILVAVAVVALGYVVSLSRLW